MSNLSFMGHIQSVYDKGSLFVRDTKKLFYKISSTVFTIYQNHIYVVVRDYPKQSLIFEILLIAISVFFVIFNYLFSFFPFCNIITFPGRVISLIIPCVFLHILCVDKDRTILLQNMPEEWEKINNLFEEKKEKSFWKIFCSYLPTRFLPRFS